MRIRAYKNVEKPCVRSLRRDFFPAQKREIRNIRHQLENTTQGLWYNIEIAEEGQSKAILVFTLVTIIFLPLSFVTSFFGMNTSDIRDIDNSQVIFWIVAIPLTIVVGGLSLLVAYGGPPLRAQAQKLRKYKAEMQPISLRRKRGDDEEKSYDMKPGMPPRAGTFKPRRRGNLFQVAKVLENSKPVLHTDEGTYFETHGGRHMKKEYAFVRKKSKSREDEDKPHKSVSLGDMFFK